jgi:hypothetical protein
VRIAVECDTPGSEEFDRASALRDRLEDHRVECDIPADVSIGIRWPSARSPKGTPHEIWGRTE